MYRILNIKIMFKTKPEYFNIERLFRNILLKTNKYKIIFLETYVLEYLKLCLSE